MLQFGITVTTNSTINCTVMSTLARDETAELSLLERALRVLFPPRCAGCGIWHDTLFCDPCRDELEAINAPLCCVCGEPFDSLAKVLPSSVCARCRENNFHVKPPLAALRSPFEYSGSLREAIHAFKYNGKTARASQLAALLQEYLSSAPEAALIDVPGIKYIVPVPLHPFRMWRRGYNQSTLLAREFAKLNPAMEVAEILRRVRYTTPQVELSGKEREQNIKGAFGLDEAAWAKYSGALDNGCILLLDDVTTTGATLFECARVLRKAANIKPENIYALTLARSVNL